MPIHLAAAGGHTEMVTLLISVKVPLSHEDKDGMTPLHLAARYGRQNIIEIFKGKIPFNIVSAKVCNIICIHSLFINMPTFYSTPCVPLLYLTINIRLFSTAPYFDIYSRCCQ